ncbi:DNA-directed RNA polymerase I subunit rpa49 [Lithohypha guttulata]|uniref:DNA-directed RNA polymerase I subunit rpa49 n=1 Tax=Lithohypha guttulata TaxID=1690604 RepID=A0AAN7YKV9_9EURO|nr:DNA-directed RNA polymerase I subunit rpa49 [Lithohypha guttulata]KAK5090751.1 DNA-directed RNA polymerase I subunit rpa49 [Lithohypha guttulata]KAK5104452.1 DNA-directed RNA polymerase I subunit rpa49 [Lithohypha guttulata]
MSEKKRKASSAPESRPKKKQQVASTAAAIEHIPGSDVLKPIIASTPGAAFPQKIRFQSFFKKTADGSQTLLHSSEHPTIDYTAEQGTESGEAHQKHYIVIYDPSTNKLQLTEAKRLTVRGSIRQQPRLEEDDEDTANFLAQQGTRAALTEAFGSKKSKKAVQAMAENRQLGQGIEGQMIAQAITANLEADEEEEEAAEAATARLANKPLPLPDLHTDDIDRVYSLSSLIKPSPATNTLKLMPTKPWLDRLQAKKDVESRSRYIAARIAYIYKHMTSNPEQVHKYTQQLQILRYIELLHQVHAFAAKQDRRRRMPPVDEWLPQTFTPGTPPQVLREVMRHHFPEQNIPTTHAMTLLRTTILALTLHILPPSGTTGGSSGSGHGSQLVTEPSDIQLDLAIDAAEVKKLYHELGCVVKPATDKDLNIWGYTKLAKKSKEGKIPKPVFAVLKFPLNFPKVGGGKKAGGRR